ncbi:MAG: phosphoribosylformylglycinamidine synthase subunit PurQ [Myxococcota bacterium]|nr:phosphoribosylformylglycinamidine synthase subunit PurQ [Myxococcota bacterium]
MATYVRAIVLAGNGINCEMETAHACRLAGADQVDIVYLWDLASGKANLDQCDLLCMPGGFLDGDDLGSALASAIRIRHTEVGGERLFDKLVGFVNRGGLVLGMCNGFQLLVKLGLLPGVDSQMGKQQATLAWNDSGRFEDRWVSLAADPESPCVFTKDIEHMSLPVRHGEGKLVPRDDAVREALLANRQVPLFYIDPESGRATTRYPLNPNGSADGIASLTDPTGRVFGLMPHPEAFLHRTNHPKWTRQRLSEAGDGLAIFVNAVDGVRKGV